MNQQRVFRLRVTYTKAGRLAMLSHLEVTHALERTVRRSGLPFAITQGFSPHMRLSFGSALPVGVGSTCEIFDIVLDDYVAPAKALEALCRSSADGLMCIDAEYVEPSAKAASVAFPYSTYKAVFDKPISRINVPDSIEVIRKRKSKTLDVRDFLVGDTVIEGDAVVFQLKTGESGNLRPDALLSHSTMHPNIGDSSPDAESSPHLVRLSRIAQSETPIDDISAMSRLASDI